nr:hypothetical protein [uncultured Draconibacterium sp.]
MALLSKVTYTDKENVNPVVIRKNQATAEDFNELKTVLNAAVDDLNWIKADEYDVPAGTTLVPFNDAFPDGVPYAILVHNCYDSNGYLLGHTLGSQLRAGFEVTVSKACKVVYLAIRKR